MGVIYQDLNFKSILQWWSNWTFWPCAALMAEGKHLKCFFLIVGKIIHIHAPIYTSMSITFQYMTFWKILHQHPRVANLGHKMRYKDKNPMCRHFKMEMRGHRKFLDPPLMKVTSLAFVTITIGLPHKTLTLHFLPISWPLTTQSTFQPGDILARRHILTPHQIDDQSRQHCFFPNPQHCLPGDRDTGSPATAYWQPGDNTPAARRQPQIVFGCIFAWIPMERRPECMVKSTFAPHVYIVRSLALLAARQNDVGHDVMGGLHPG